METESGAWYSLAESIQAWRSAFALITFPGKKGKAPQPPSACCQLPAASGWMESMVPGCSCPLLVLALPSSRPLLPPPHGCLGDAAPSQSCVPVWEPGLELCWCCPWAGPSGAASVTRACLQNKELLHRHVSNSVCCEERENTGTNLRAQKPPHAQSR